MKCIQIEDQAIEPTLKTTDYAPLEVVRMYWDPKTNNFRYYANIVDVSVIGVGVNHYCTSIRPDWHFESGFMMSQMNNAGNMGQENRKEFGTYFVERKMVPVLE